MDDKKHKDDEKASEDTDLGQPVETEDGEQPRTPPTPPVEPPGGGGTIEGGRKPE